MGFGKPDLHALKNRMTPPTDVLRLIISVSIFLRRPYRETPMTYLQFHLIFNLPVFLLLLVALRGRLKSAHWAAIAATASIAFLAASPWDLWAVERGIWGFDWDRATKISFEWRGTTWVLPAEEYAFFIIEAVLVSLLAVFFLPKPVKAP